MKRNLRLLAGVVLLFAAAAIRADEFTDTVKVFKNAGASQTFFANSYGYAVFPTVGKGGLGIGGAYGKGRVYKQGQHVGDTSVTQVSIGLQAGGQAYSEIIFFQDQRSFDDFTKGSYEFSGDVNAVAITAGAGASAGTAGASAGASGGQKDATTAGKYYKGLAVFVIVKGGAMAQAAVGGQKFSYKPKA